MADEMGAKIMQSVEVRSSGEREAKRDAARKAMREIEDEFYNTIHQNPEVMELLNKWSKDVEVVKSLASDSLLTLHKDKNATATTPKELSGVAAIVGYRVRNNGKEGIPFVHELWEKGDDGVWVPHLVDKVLQPGEEVELSKVNMVAFAKIPEISLQFANGKLVCGEVARARKLLAAVGLNKESLGLDNYREIYSMFYFKIQNQPGKVKVTVHDSKFKEMVCDCTTTGEGRGKKTVIKVRPGHEEVFGYLENGTVKEKKKGFTQQQMFAAALRGESLNE